jgi:hypothetical protein
VTGAERDGAPIRSFVTVSLMTASSLTATSSK